MSIEYKKSADGKGADVSLDLKTLDEAIAQYETDLVVNAAAMNDLSEERRLISIKLDYSKGLRDDMLKKFPEIETKVYPK